MNTLEQIEKLLIENIEKAAAGKLIQLLAGVRVAIIRQVARIVAWMDIWLMSYISPPNQQAYYELVWNFVRQVPHGLVVTYGQIAQMLPAPDGVDLDDYKSFSPRWVGAAMATCPDDVPWQRVINSQGKISSRPGAQRQRKLLEEEGVVFRKDKVDLNVYQWLGPGHEDRPRQARLF